MKFKAQLVGVDSTAKPVQVFSNSKEELRRWAREVLDSVDHKYELTASVIITEQTWIVVESIR